MYSLCCGEALYRHAMQHGGRSPQIGASLLVYSAIGRSLAPSPALCVPWLLCCRACCLLSSRVMDPRSMRSRLPLPRPQPRARRRLMRSLCCKEALYRQALQLGRAL